MHENEKEVGITGKNSGFPRSHRNAETREVLKSHLRKKATDNTFTPMETGQPDEDQVPDSDNPQAVQGGLGPLNEEGEGERQNDQLAELEQIEPEQ